MPHPRARLRRAFAILLAGTLATACSTLPGRDAAPLFERTTLAKSGDNGVHTYRIPALAVAKDGTLLASYDARLDSAHDLPGNIDILLRRSHAQGGYAPDSRTQHPRYIWSDDNGLTWQGPRDLLAAIKRPDWKGMFATSGQ